MQVDDADDQLDVARSDAEAWHRHGLASPADLDRLVKRRLAAGPSADYPPDEAHQFELVGGRSSTGGGPTYSDFLSADEGARRSAR